MRSLCKSGSNKETDSVLLQYDAASLGKVVPLRQRSFQMFGTTQPVTLCPIPDSELLNYKALKLSNLQHRVKGLLAAVALRLLHFYCLCRGLNLHTIEMKMEAGNFLESFRSLDKLSITLKLRMTGDLHGKT